MEKQTKSIKKTEEQYRRDLLHDEGYWVADWQLKLFAEIKNYLEINQLKDYQFGEKIGVGKSYISQVLNGNFNHKISTLIKLALASGKAPILNFENLDEYINNDILGVHQLPKESHNLDNILVSANDILQFASGKSEVIDLSK